MRIAFDLDGVLADLHSSFARAAVELFPGLEREAIAAADLGVSPPEDGNQSGAAAPAPAAGPPPALTHAQSDAVWQRLRTVEDFWETLDEIEAGAIERLAALSLEHRWEVLFVTSRPDAPGKTVQRQSQLWLERKKFPLPSLYVVQGSRGQIAQALAIDVVVDDRPQNCLDVVLESKARAILVWRGKPGTMPASAKRMGIGVVPTVAACLDTLVQAQHENASDGDFVSRLRRLLGLSAARR
jgi:hypothetical protein